jgi:hypothetical protein
MRGGSGGVDREMADRVLREAMAAVGASGFRQTVVYNIVRNFGPAGDTQLNKFSRQFHRPAQETQIMLPRNFDRAKLL